MPTRKRRSIKRGLFIFCAVGLFLYVGGLGIAGAYGCSVERLPMDEWGFDHKYIPPEADRATWPSGVTARCGNIFWSYDQWRVGFIRLERCNY